MARIKGKRSTVVSKRKSKRKRMRSQRTISVSPETYDLIEKLRGRTVLDPWGRLVPATDGDRPTRGQVVAAAVRHYWDCLKEEL